jgi:hypothetical protein
MTGAKRLVATCAVTVSAWLVATTALAADQLVLPARARVGIITMVSPELTHYHVGKSRLGSFMRTYRLGWPVPAVLDDPIAAMLKGMGFEPVFLEPTDPLWRQRQNWIISNPLSNKLPKDAAQELAGILDAQNLQGLVIVAPGTNANPVSSGGDRLRKLPDYLQGWGFSTSDDADGVARPVVFNLTQMLVVGRSSDSSELIFRDWGGARVYEWPGFQPGTDLKALSAEAISKFRPVMQEMLQTQIERLTPRIRVADQG